MDQDFDAFVRCHATSLLRTAVLLTGDRHAAEDLLQETLTHLYPRWDRVSSAEVPSAYVRRSLTNRFISSRRAGRGRDVALWEVPDGWDGRDMSEAVSTQQAIWQLLGSLSERQRAALVLRYYNDMADEEIGAAIGCRPATVRSLISRGVAELRGAVGGRHTVVGWEVS